MASASASGSGPTRIILVLGPTAAGKSALAAALAGRLDGEVVSADAFAVYRGMDVGTAKPDPATRARVPHHLIDVLEPGDRCDAQRWCDLAEAAIAGIAARGRVPVVAGGTPLYTKLLIEGISAGAPRDERLRAELAAADPAALWAELQRVDPAYAAQRHPNDLRRIMRAIEVFRLTGKPYSSFHVTDGSRRTDLAALQLGITWDKAVLHQRIAARTAGLFAAGLVDEVRRLRPRLSPEALQAVGYKEVVDHLDGRLTLDACMDAVAQGTRRLAKHQLTWYRRFRDIVWLPGDAPDLIDRAEALARAHLDPGRRTQDAGR
jgi:tRNA dimethylallyltransferase